ncbi:hypothetical protein FWG86_02475 [Candidatus Saccharibacteria bacterium]|nr:hypothetical protein [Candidatus Saccharibacteria bacterium]
METNLAYAGGGSNLYGDAIFLTQGRSNTPTAPLFDIPPGANPTAATTDPSLSTDGGATNPQYGYLYNWCAAMGNQPDACQTSTAAQPDPNISVCPAGWRLPTGDPTTGEFTTLVDQLGWTSGAPTPLLTNGLYMYAGYFWNGSFNDQGSSGSYWSSTVTNAANAFYLTFVTGGVNPAGSNSKGYGLSVRCVSDAAEPAEPLPSPAPAPTGADIQRITLDGTLGNYSCPTTRTRVRDARDGSTYWVRRINGTQAGGGDLCWMETNLAYAGGGTNTYGDAIPAMTLGNSHTTSTQACYGNNPAVVANPTTRCYWNPTGSNRTTGTTDPSTSTNGGATNPQYGYFYNWCTAMNLQAAACQSSTATQPNQSVNGGTGAGATGSTLYNICPSGWRLPTGNTGGEFTLLNNAINSGSLTTPAGLLANGLYMYAGYFADGAFSNQGSFGYSWSSTVDSATNAFRLYFGSTFVDPAYAVSKGRGVPLRCVAP